MASEYIPTGRGNSIMKCDGFSVSYNPSPGAGFSFFESDGGQSETALLIGGEFLILNGDFREEYAALSKEGLEACIQFFESHSELTSSWSDTVEDVREAMS